MAKQIEILDGYHLTQTERKAILLMLDKGIVNARNKTNTKNYCIISGWNDSGKKHYQVKIGTFGTHTIGAEKKWVYYHFIIKIN